jgi:hypothetical protein
MIDRSVSDELTMKVIYKLPNKLVKKTAKKVLVSSWSISGDYNEFLKACKKELENKIMLAEVGKKLIVDDLNKRNKKTTRDILENEVYSAIKSINNEFIEIEVEY